jgi:Na+-translocating ferredoxin:NAD+ oxidoreductase subunit E
VIREEFKRGLIDENPLLRLGLGLCPAVAICTSVINAIGMGIAVTFTIICSNLIISIIGKWIPEKVRPPCTLVIISAIVTIADLWMKTHTPVLSHHLGIFVPLIAANCIVLSRAEVFASKNNLVKSALDGIVMGLGFTISLFLLAAVREILGNNTLLGFQVVPGFQPISLFLLAPGGFFTFAALLWITRFFHLKKGKNNC